MVPRRFRRAAIAACALALALASQPPVANAETRTATQFALPNGLTVAVLEDHALPIVSLRLVYRTSRTPSPAGLQFVAPRLMLDATAHVARGQYDSLLAAAGGQDSTWGITVDDTWFRITVPANVVDLPLWLWSDQMAFLAPRLDAPMMDRAVSLALQDRRMRVDESPCGIAEEAVRHALYGASHPYRVAPRGLQDGVAGKIDVATMQAFVERTYTPGDAALFLVGDITPVEAREHVAKWFGDVRGAPRAAEPVDEALPTEEVRIAARANVSAARVRISWRIPRALDDAERWESLQRLLGGNETGLLRWKLRDELHLVSRANATYSRRAFGSVFSFDFVVEPAHQPAEVEAAVDAFLANLVAVPPRSDYFEWARQQVERQRLLDSESSSERAESLAGRWIKHEKLTLSSETSPFDMVALHQLVGRALVPGHRAVFACAPDPSSPIAGVASPAAVSQGNP
jgi:zinc protease